MATETVQQQSPLERMRRAEDRTDAFGAAALKFVEALASLKLTVVLFAMAIFIVFAGTLAQAEMGLWQTVDKYFRSAVCWIDLQIFFPASFFPSRPDIPDWMGFWFPGGWLIGGLMAVNLLAAHGLRFKVQTKGTRLAVGLGVVVLGLLATGLVIASGYNPDGFQHSIWADNWTLLWTIVQVGLGLTLVAALYGYVHLWRKMRRTSEWRWLRYVVTAALLGLAALAYYAFFSEKRLPDAGLRILWQLIKAEAAALLLLAGCILAFKKRAGIVLLHGGVGLMMLGEIVAGTEVIETMMVIREGETVNYVQHQRQIELAFVDRSDPQQDYHVVIPGSTLKQYEDRDEPIRHEELPVDVEVVDFMKNSQMVNPSADDGKRPENPADSGAGRSIVVAEVPAVSGTDTGERSDASSVYVRFLDKKTGEPLGTWLASFYLDPQPVSVAGNTWHVQLRPKRIYKPYAVTLKDVSAKHYIASNTPKDYRSKVHLVDKTRNIDRDAVIWMNNPLRYAGETFYQSGYLGPPQVPFEQTTLAVVQNPSWMIPYVGCMIVVTGMFVHFAFVLVRFLNRRAASRSGSAPSSGFPAEHKPASGDDSPQTAMARRYQKETGAGIEKDRPPAPQPELASAGSAELSRWLVPTAVALVFLLFVGRIAVPPSADPGEPDLYRFGSMPVTAQGRVKPMDTLARSTLQKISKKQTFYPHDAETKRLLFGLSKKRISEPTIVWLLDVMAHTDDAEKHQVFRIENLDVLDALNLPRRKGLRYSLEEIEREHDEFRKQVKLAREVVEEEGEEGLNLFQSRILDLNGKVQQFYAIRVAHQLPPSDPETAYEQIQYIRAVNSRRADLTQVPYAVPVESDEQPWEPLAVASTRAWIQQMAEDKNCRTVDQLVEKLVQQTRDDGSAEKAVHDEMLRTLAAFLLQQSQGRMTVSEARRLAPGRLDNMPPDIRNTLETIARRNVVDDLPERLKMAVTGILGSEMLDDPPNAVAVALTGVLRAYRDGDAGAFNAGLDSYSEALAATDAAEYSATKVGFEAYYNHFAPTFWPAWLYLFAFVLTAAGWIGWERHFNRAAFWLIVLTFGLHTFGLISRIYISGRPPVTNLYSSAVFIAWGTVVLALVVELIYRNGVGNVTGSIAGFLALLVAYFLGKEGDTFTVMQAVLDTQFWLATHVVCITLGYSTTYAAGLLGLYYIARGVVTPSLSPQLGREVARMIYGMLCFAILFSFFGTVLGGLWADDSWGRFWGWDPKENGALIIVLWNALVLHARWDRLVKERGLAVLASVGTLVVSWSWFGTNMLGIGLHAYGGQEGQMIAFKAAMGVLLGLVALGCLPKELWWSFRRHGRADEATA